MSYPTVTRFTLGICCLAETIVDWIGRDMTLDPTRSKDTFMACHQLELSLLGWGPTIRPIYCIGNFPNIVSWPY